MSDVIPTEDLHLALRVVAAMVDEPGVGYQELRILELAAEVLRLSYRARTLHHPLPGQTTLADS